MDTEILERPARLTIWANGATKTPMSGPKRFKTLREALAAARDLTDPSMQPWIVTEDGDMLAPTWIRSQTA